MLPLDPIDPVLGSSAFEKAGFDANRLAAAVNHAHRRETAWAHDLRAVIEVGTFDPPPWNIVLGPTKPRGGPSGLIIRGDRIAAAWGDLARPDMIFSVTKSYVAAVAGLALDRGLIGGPDEAVARGVDHPAFASTRNRRVTWRQLLQHTSEWEGTLWSIPDRVDRNRQLSPDEDGSRFDTPHDLAEPGTYWDYNDIRVNALCLALTCLFRRPLGAVLHDDLFEPMGVGRLWKWWGLKGGAVEIDGRRSPVVVGGGHWGGGLVTTARHDAAFGLLVKGNGLWRGQRLLSHEAITLMRSPCPLNPLYGGLWWLNTERRLYPAAPETSLFALGVGLNAIWVDTDLDLVLVARWIDEAAFGELVRLVMAALRA